MTKKTYAETYTMRSRHYQLLGEAGRRAAEAYREADLENQRDIRENLIKAFEHCIVAEHGYTELEIAVAQRAKPELKRMWINQPSEGQSLHDLHGINVLAIEETDTASRVYFLTGGIISQQVPTSALSEGWQTPKPVKLTDAFAAFQTYQSETIRATRGLPDLMQLAMRLDAARDKLKASLGPIADHIDWSLE